MLGVEVEIEVEIEIGYGGIEVLETVADSEFGMSGANNVVVVVVVVGRVVWQKSRMLKARLSEGRKRETRRRNLEERKNIQQDQWGDEQSRQERRC